MKIFVDIDDTICFYKDGLDKYSTGRNYADAIPSSKNIKKINKGFLKFIFKFIFQCTNS